MTESNDYECEISKSWALININLDEKSPPLFDSQDDCNSPNFFLQEKAQGDTENKDAKNDKFLESSKDIKIICNHTFDCNKLPHNSKIIATDKIQDKSIVNDNDNISDSSDSIEVLDSDSSLTDSYDSLSILNNNNEDGMDNSNFIKLDNNEDTEVFNNNDRANLVKRKKKLLNIFSQCHNVHNGDQYEPFEDKKQNGTKDLRIAIYKAKSLQVQNCYSIIKNIAFNLSLIIFFIGMLCFIAGNILGVYESLSGANKSSKIMKNMELSLHLKEINTGFDTKEMDINSKQNVYDLFEKINLKESTLMTHNSNNKKIGTTRNLSQPSFNSNFLKNSSKSKFRKIKEIRGVYEKKNVANFIKVLNYLYRNLNSININYKDIKAKCFEELIPVISKILEPILLCISSQNNTKMNYQKLEITLEDKFNISSYVKEVMYKKPLLVSQTVTKSESSHTKNKTFLPALTYSFPQPREFYANDKNYYSEANDKIYKPKVYKNKKETEKDKKLNNSFPTDESRKNKKMNNNLNGEGKQKILKRHDKKQKGKGLNKNGKQYCFKMSNVDLFNNIKSKIYSGVKEKVKNKKFYKSKRTNSLENGNHNFSNLNKNQCPYDSVKSDIKNVPFNHINDKDNSNGYWQFERAKSRQQNRMDNFNFYKYGDRNFKRDRGVKDKNYWDPNWQFERAEARKHLRQNFHP